MPAHLGKNRVFVAPTLHLPSSIPTPCHPPASGISAAGASQRRRPKYLPGASSVPIRRSLCRRLEIVPGQLLDPPVCAAASSSAPSPGELVHDIKQLKSFTYTLRRTIGIAHIFWSVLCGVFCVPVCGTVEGEETATLRSVISEFSVVCVAA